MHLYKKLKKLKKLNISVRKNNRVSDAWEFMAMVMQGIGCRKTYSLARLFDTLHHYLNDPLARGFLLATILLLGVGLEQGLLCQSPCKDRSLFFLVGNLLGLPLAVFIWRTFYPGSILPLLAWPLEGFLVAASAWKPLPEFSFFQGLFLGTLLLHLAMFAHGRKFSTIIEYTGVGIIAGNLALYCLKWLPAPMGLTWLAVALAACRIKRPGALPSFLAGRPLPSSWLRWFWILFFGFYTLGGLYYTLLSDANPALDQDLFDILSLVLYLVGIMVAIVMRNRLARLIPYLAITVMGLGLIMQISPATASAWSLSMMDLGFGIMDCFSIAFILCFSESMALEAMGFSIYPVSIILGMFLTGENFPRLILDYQWSLSFLFLMIIPASFCTRFLHEDPDGNQQLLALPCRPGEYPPAFVDTNIGAKMDEEGKGRSDNNGLVSQVADSISLSEREREVFFKLSEGRKLKEIAEDLGIALGTVKALSNRIYEKAGVRGRKELARLLVTKSRG